MATMRVRISVRCVSSSRASCAASCRSCLVARFALVPHVAARAHHAAEHVVREFDAAHVEAILDSQQTSIDQCRERIRRGTGGGQCLGDALFGEAFAIARTRSAIRLRRRAARRPAGLPMPARRTRDRIVSREPASKSAEISSRPCAWRTVFSSRQIRLSSEGSTSALASSEPPATKRTIDSATSSDTRRPPGFTTAVSACAPVMRARRMRFCVMEGMIVFTPSRCAR